MNTGRVMMVGADEQESSMSDIDELRKWILEVADVLLFEEEGHWSAQCLQYDIGAEAGTLKEVLDEIERSLVGYVAICLERGVRPFTNLRPAPERYWTLFREAQVSVKAPKPPAVRIDSGALDAPRLRYLVASAAH